MNGAAGGPAAPLTELSGWGHHPVVRAHEVRGEDLERITAGAILTRGLGRSYGDSSLPPGPQRVASTVLADRLLAFDPATGVVRAEAGVPLWRLNRTFLARGWFTPVTPGTHFVTLGGMVAADVHGKSHHVDGCFGQHVLKLRLRVASGEIIECSDECEPELFRATLGGMGLTGHILEVEFRLKRIPSPWIWQETERLPNFNSVVLRLQEASKEWPFTVCWADFLGGGSHVGRGILTKGRWAEPYEAPHEPPQFRSPITVPPIVPSWGLRRSMVRAFNWLYYVKQRSPRHPGIVHPETFFYPLDVVREWNRLYGKRGFTQYQCVLPYAGDLSPHQRLLQLLQHHKAPVYLCVIKDCGPEGKGMLSFPRPGVSYALDIPIHARIQEVIDALNELVIAEGGRVYLAKDAFTRGEHFRKMDARIAAWEAVRQQWDPHGILRSAQSVRVLGDRP